MKFQLLIFNEKDKDKAIAQKAIEKLDEDIKILEKKLEENNSQLTEILEKSLK